MKLLIVGAGDIVPEYVKALRELGIHDIAVLSRNPERAAARAEQLGLVEHYGGGEMQLNAIAARFDAIVLAASIESLVDLLEVCANQAPDTPILVEKPVALSSAEIVDFLVRYPNNSVSVALNRLYFPSVGLVRQRLLEEHVTSAHFSFTEWVHKIDPAKFSERELGRWGMSNCIHVIATVFDLIGTPVKLATQVSGQDTIPWHPSGSIFAGAGRTEAGVAFSYLSDWTSAGRWSISIGTSSGRYDLIPMEGVSFTAKGTVHPDVIMPPYSGPTKCGFAEMLAVWLGKVPNNGRGPATLAELAGHLKTTEAIFGY